MEPVAVGRLEDGDVGAEFRYHGALDRILCKGGEITGVEQGPRRGLQIDAGSARDVACGIHGQRHLREDLQRLPEADRAHPVQHVQDLLLRIERDPILRMLHQLDGVIKENPREVHCHRGHVDRGKGILRGDNRERSRVVHVGMAHDYAVHAACLLNAAKIRQGVFPRLLADAAVHQDLPASNLQEDAACTDLHGSAEKLEGQPCRRLVWLGSIFRYHRSLHFVVMQSFRLQAQSG